MAEAFARTYGSDVMIPASAGLAPAYAHRARYRARHGRKEHRPARPFPKSLRHLGRAEFDLVDQHERHELAAGHLGPVRDGMSKIPSP